MFHKRIHLLLSCLALATLCLTATPVQAQDKPEKDPTAESSVISETLRTIKEVEKLNQYIEQNKSLVAANKQLNAQIATLSKQVAQLTQQVKTQNDSIRKQLLSLPPLTIRSKVIGKESSMAVIAFGEKSIRIREQTEMSVPVENGIWTLMKVEKISKDFIELKFLELDRTIKIHD